MQDTVSVFVGKLLAVALVTASISVAGAYFVAKKSRQSVEAAIERTNTRIDDLRDDLGSLRTNALASIDLQLEALQQRLNSEFEDIRKQFKAAEVDLGAKVAGAPPDWRPVAFGSIQLLLDANAASLKAISTSDPLFADWAQAAGNAEEARNIMADGLMIAAARNAGKIDVKWVGKAQSSGTLLAEFLKFKECVTVIQRSDGSAVVVPAAEKSVVGNDGFLCTSVAH